MQAVKKIKESDLPVWFYGIDATMNRDSQHNVVLTDAYAGVSYGGLNLFAGKKAEFFGLADTLLTAGPNVYSRNAPTIPKIAISTNGFIELNDLFAVNAYFAHGWMGDENFVKNAFLHQKFLYLRYGESNPRKGINIYAGIHHLAIWGGTNRVNGEHYPSGLDDFWRVISGKAGDAGAAGIDRQNALGDHRGSIDYALLLKGRQRDWHVYAGTLFEDGSGIKLFKWYDYFAGVSMINKGVNGVLKRVNFEVFNTMNHGNNPWEPDNYFNNYEYQSGWTYNGFGIGHPFIRFITGKNYQYTAQNRVRAVNASALLHFSRLANPYLRMAYSENYGYVNEPLSDNNQIKIFSFDITNTSFLYDGWSLTQELCFDTGKNVNGVIGGSVTVTKTVF